MQPILPGNTYNWGGCISTVLPASQNSSLVFLAFAPEYDEHVKQNPSLFPVKNFSLCRAHIWFSIDVPWTVFYKYIVTIFFPRELKVWDHVLTFCFQSTHNHCYKKFAGRMRKIIYNVSGCTHYWDMKGNVSFFFSPHTEWCLFTTPSLTL